MDKTYTLYKMNFPNGKCYVGVTSQVFSIRMAGHKYQASLEGKKASKQPVHKAIRAFGWDNVEIEVLDKEIPSENIDTLEINTIEKYASLITINGYNISPGGVLHKEHSKETREKIAKAHLGKQPRLGAVLSQETKDKISKAHVGKVISEETKQKLKGLNTGNKFAAGNKHTEEFKKRQADRLKGNKINLGRKCSEENKLKSSERMKEHYKNIKQIKAQNI